MSVKGRIWCTERGRPNANSHTNTNSAAWPSGIKPVAVPMDGGGITVEGLDSVLREWNEEERGGMKRFVFFLFYSLSR